LGTGRLGVLTEVEEPLLRAAAWYFLRARGRNGAPLDPVARFHLGNGARLERLNWLADVSDKGLEQSHGLMVNYRYELDDIEKNHEAYAQHRTVIAASAVTRLVKGSARDVVPVAG
jgi:malonyl-CoA decarboxylase